MCALNSLCAPLTVCVQAGNSLCAGRQQFVCRQATVCVQAGNSLCAGRQQFVCRQATVGQGMQSSWQAGNSSTVQQMFNCSLLLSFLTCHFYRRGNEEYPRHRAKGQASQWPFQTAAPLAFFNPEHFLLHSRRFHSCLTVVL